MSTTAAGAPAMTPHRWGTAPEFVGPRHQFRERLLLSSFVRANSGREVLNVGAGQGTFSQLLEGRGFRVTSTDLSPDTLAVLRTRVRGEVLQADACALPFDDEAFDAVVLGEVLEHLEQDATALAEARRVLAPGGIVAISVPGASIPFGPADHWAGHVRKYTRSGLTQLLENSGFHVDRCVPWGFPVSALYHRHLYEPRLARKGSEAATAPRSARIALRLMLQVDRLFLGVERRSMGLLAVARRQ